MNNNIVIAHSLYTPHIIGGAEISTQILAECMSRKYSVKVITVGNHNEKNVKIKTVNDVDVLQLHHANIYWFGEAQHKKNSFAKILWRVNDAYNFKQYKILKKILADIRPRILHTQNLPGLSLSIWKAADELNIPIIHTLRDFSLIEPVPVKMYSNMYQTFAKRLSRSVAAVIGITKNVLTQHTDRGYFPNAKQFVIPNAVESNSNGYDFYRRKVISHNKPLRIGYFGQLSNVKGVNYLIEAVLNLPPQVIDKMLICGDGPEGPFLKDLAGNDQRIQFTGRLERDEASRIMSEVDLTVVPSIWDEPFGRVIIESYQVGTNVLASNVGGIPEVIIDRGKYLFKPKDSKAIMDSIISYFNLSYKDKLQLKINCYEHSKKFNVDSLFLEHEKIYDGILKNVKKYEYLQH